MESASPLRVLAVIEATSITGPAKNLLQFAELARPGVEVSILTFSRTGDSTKFLDAARALNLSAATIPERGRFDSNVMGRLRKAVESAQPDLIQTHAVKSHFLTRCARLPEIAPWVAFHHGYTWPDWYVHLYNQLDRWSLRSASQIITVSQSFRRELMDMGIAGDHIEVLSNAISPEWGKGRPDAIESRTRWGIAADKPVILIVGRLSVEKDHLTLLDSLALLHQGGRVAPHLVAVGEGPERTAIEAHIAALNLAPHVTLTGQVDSAESFYGWADLVAISSRSEGSPNALLEAMAAGVPVVATAVGGIPEMVADQVTARLVPSGSSKALQAAIEELLTCRQSAQEMAARARELVETRYSPLSRVEQLEGIYRRLLR